MATTNPARESLLKVLLSFMRGEIDNFQFSDEQSACIEECHTLGDRSALNVCDILFNMSDSYVKHQFSASLDEWNLLRRYASFLQTDLVLRRIESRQKRSRRTLALMELVLLTFAGCILFLYGSWVPLVVLWIVIATSWVIFPPPQVRDEEIEAMWQWAPFWSEDQWKQYEPLADQLDLPEYDPAVHDRPIRSEKSEKRFELFQASNVFLNLPLTLLWHCFSGKHHVYMVTNYESPGES